MRALVGHRSAVSNSTIRVTCHTLYTKSAYGADPLAPFVVRTVALSTALDEAVGDDSSLQRSRSRCVERAVYNVRARRTLAHAKATRAQKHADCVSYSAHRLRR